MTYNSILRWFDQIKQWENHFYTIYLLLNTISYGILFTMFPTILVDMKYILNTSMSLITLYTTVETVGYIFGTLVGLTYKYLNRQLVMCITYSLLTIACAVLPMVPNIGVLYVCAMIIGFGSSVQMCGHVVWFMEIWQNKSRPILQFNDFAFSIGCILCTVILKPFLVGETDNLRPLSQYVVPTNGTDLNDIDRRSRLTLPCLLIGVCILPISISSFVMYFIKPYKTCEIVKQTDDSVKKEIKLFDRPETPRKTVRILFALWFTLYVVFETIFLKFAITYFQYCPQRLTAQKAAEILSISTAVYTAFRAINVLIGFKLSVFTIIVYHYVLLVVGMVLMVIGERYLIVLWTGSVVVCWSFSAMFSCIFAFSGHYLTITDRLTTVFVLIRGLFTLVTPLIIGAYIEEYSMIFIIVNVFYLITSLIAFFAIKYFIRRYSDSSDVC